MTELGKFMGIADSHFFLPSDDSSVVSAMRQMMQDNPQRDPQSIIKDLARKASEATGKEGEGQEIRRKSQFHRRQTMLAAAGIEMRSMQQHGGHLPSVQGSQHPSRASQRTHGNHDYAPHGHDQSAPAGPEAGGTWSYRKPDGQVFSGFSGEAMSGWFLDGHFAPELAVCHSTWPDFCSLGDAFRGVPPRQVFLSVPPYPHSHSPSHSQAHSHIQPPPPPPPSASLPASIGGQREREIRHLVSLIYGHFRPDKRAEDLDAVLDEWRGREEELLSNVRAKYCLGPGHSRVRDVAWEMRAIYSVHCPGKERDVDAILSDREWRGREEELLGLVRAKYPNGPAAAHPPSPVERGSWSARDSLAATASQPTRPSLSIRDSIPTGPLYEAAFDYECEFDGRSQYQPQALDDGGARHPTAPALPVQGEHSHYAPPVGTGAGLPHPTREGRPLVNRGGAPVARRLILGPPANSHNASSRTGPGQPHPRPPPHPHPLPHAHAHALPHPQQLQPRQLKPFPRQRQPAEPAAPGPGEREAGRDSQGSQRDSWADRMAPFSPGSSGRAQPQGGAGKRLDRR